MDLIGNDVNFAVSRSVYESTFHDPRYRPSVTQQRYVEAGWLGQKIGAWLLRLRRRLRSAPAPATDAAARTADRRSRACDAGERSGGGGGAAACVDGRHRDGHDERRELSPRPAGVGRCHRAATVLREIERLQHEYSRSALSAARDGCAGSRVQREARCSMTDTPMARWRTRAWSSSSCGTDAFSRWLGIEVLEARIGYVGRAHDSARGDGERLRHVARRHRVLACRQRVRVCDQCRPAS